MRASDILDGSEVSGRHPRGAFAGWPMILGWAAMLVFALHACTHMVAAGDTWVAMACGRHFVNHGVDTVEPFSANSHKAGPTAEEVEAWPGWARWITNKVGLETVQRWHPTGWVNQNWLTHVIFYRLTTALGSQSEPYYDALVLWKFALYILAAAALYYTARVYGVNRALAVIAVCFALFIGRSFFDIRPAGFSNLLTAVLILILALASYRNALYVWLIVPVIIFWSNVHGGYIYAFIVLVPFLGWHAIMNLPRRWAVAAYAILLWLVLYGMAYQFLGHEHLTRTPVWKDVLFYLVVLAIGGSVALTVNRRVPDSAIVPYHATVSCILFLIIMVCFFPGTPRSLSQGQRAAFEVHVAGARLAYFAIFSLAMIVGAVVVSLREKVVQAMKVRGILHVVAAGAVAFVAMVVFNPFHLTNLTHTFVISVSKHAERWRDVHEWHRAFAWDNPVGTAVPFLVMYILGWVVLVAWAAFYLHAARVVNAPVAKKAKTKASLSYDWPKIDLALLIIAALTIYMAIRSRRFIPIAGFVACPITALLVDHAVRVVAAMAQTARVDKLEVPLMPAIVQWITVILGGMAVLSLGLLWGIRFYTVYLDSWPADPRHTSIFMRMTASDAKPFAACEFIRKNKLSGKMFNYWTEGGFIAWGQDPDPNTGRVPLQLFMDGRAQAAYDVKAFDRWTEIMSGGPATMSALMEQRRLTADECTQTGTWVTDQLRTHGVWAVLMPKNQSDKSFTDGLEYSRHWRTAYMDDEQKLFVDVNSTPGEQLFQGMFTGKTVYPDKYSAKLTTGHNLLLSATAAQRRKGLELLIEAMEENPAPAPMVEMVMLGTHFTELRPRIDQICEKYVKDFEGNTTAWAGQDGYSLRLETIRVALMRLQEVARTNRNPESAEAYDRQIKQYDAERERALSKKRW